MLLSSFDHYSITTDDLDGTRDFYRDVLGLEHVDRPPFNIAGHWLALDGKILLHLIATPETGAQGSYPLAGGLEFDDVADPAIESHIAFNISEPMALVAHFKEHGVAYRDRHLPKMNLYQAFLKDPNGVIIELNYRYTGEAEGIPETAGSWMS